MKMKVASMVVIAAGLVFAVLGFLSNDRKKRILGGLILLFLAMGIGKDLGWWLN
ncbi:hypothetical protein [Fusobacterium sp. IOR10]|uniref:hypothetical protein n=1 Tax=Fusobacterium sp. IOR10 TaxID=2665157 RepID=UPI0013D1B667|nr:hypothetical protein [Fusobacterium sp. IOR10]